MMCASGLAGGGSESSATADQAWSIPVENLEPLLSELRRRCEEWIVQDNPRNDLGPNKEKPIPWEWDGFSYVVKEYFENRKVVPYEHDHFKSFYVQKRHNACVSYVWAGTKLTKIAGSSCAQTTALFLLTFLCFRSDEFKKKQYSGMRVFIDVLVVPQNAVGDVVKRTSFIYRNCIMLIFVGEKTSNNSLNLLHRAWCCLELACGTLSCELVVIGKFAVVESRNFYHDMEASFPGDIQQIQEEIISIHKTPERFNEVVSEGMRLMLVSALQSSRCKLFDCPRADRPEWKALLDSKNPVKKERDLHLDWAILSGGVETALREKASKREFRVYLSSSHTDTILERTAILSDVLPFLQKCARNRGFDFVFADMRKGLREGELTVDTTRAELTRCLSAPPGVCFILISGDRYGHRPIPTRIPQEEFESLTQKMSEEDKTLVEKWYLLDLNNLNGGAEYVLKELKDTFDFQSAIVAIRKAFCLAARSVWPGAEQQDLLNAKR